MISDKASKNRFWYGSYEGYESRIQHRLINDLGVDETAAQAIMHLRNQVVELQSRIRQMESELKALHTDQQLRLARHGEVYHEAIWIEVEFEE